MTKCMEANVRENFDIIRPVSFNITVLDLDAPSVDGAIVSEYYPNYIDFDEMYGKHLDNVSINSLVGIKHVYSSRKN